MLATDKPSDMDTGALESTYPVLNSQMDIDKNKVCIEKKRKTGHDEMEYISTTLVLEETIVMPEKSGQTALTPKNPGMISSEDTTNIDLHILTSLEVIDIKFSPENPYLEKQQTIDSHVDDQVITVNAGEVRNYPNVQETKVDSGTEIARPILDEDCFFNFDIVDHTKGNSSMDATTVMEVDSKATVTGQLVIDKQKFGHSNPYEVLTHDIVIQNENENYIEIEGNKTEMDTGLEVSIKEREEERMEGTKGERMETESVNTIEGDEEVGRQETKYMSYSKAAGRYKRKKRVVEYSVDNRWAEDVKAELIGLLKKERNTFDCELWGYDKMIEAFENPT
ncbi:hypothetical protein C2G38_2200929 [Gigaspora rosea]|uniref:Uncharacterized protein n=1 Tax=Gigaspora rosea TaxID=44941 RepID=A0A397UR95_9GLOM|nr:hypothetical protein C2G38_2200929 [Gigaspora rosea]